MENVLNFSKVNMVAEVELVYKSKVWRCGHISTENRKSQAVHIIKLKSFMFL
jgi:hypothetical protein